MCLQHFPKLIEKMLYSIGITFKDEEGNTIPDENWKGNELPIKFLSVLNRLPCSVFFFSDRDVRSYILMGNLINETNGKRIDEKTVALEGETLENLCNRVYTACWFMMVFCHHSGFDPKEYIQALLDEMDFPFVTYEMVKENFDADLIKGIHIMAIPITSEEDNQDEDNDSAE